MRQSIKNKISNIIALADKSTERTVVRSSTRMVNDNLSKAIRSHSDALVFKKELKNAFQMAKSKK